MNHANPNSVNAAPFLVSAQVTLASGASGIADAGALSQPFRRPFWIDEIRWNIRVPIAGTGPKPWGGLISTKLALGRMMISDKFIPIWNYCTEMQQLQATSQQWDKNFGPLVGPPGGAGTSVSFSAYRWKLPTPLYVPAGNTVVSEFQRYADGGSNALITVSYAGRYIDQDEPSRKEIDVPFVGAFLPGFPSTTTVQSGENDLYNPFLVPLHVQRLTGRLINNVFGVYAEVASGSHQFPNTNVQLIMKDSFGHNVVRDFTNFLVVFDTNRRAWTFGKTLSPGQLYSAYFQNLVSTDMLSVALIGTRKEQLA